MIKKTSFLALSIFFLAITAGRAEDYTPPDQLPTTPVVSAPKPPVLPPAPVEPAPVQPVVVEPLENEFVMELPKNTPPAAELPAPVEPAPVQPAAVETLEAESMMDLPDNAPLAAEPLAPDVKYEQVTQAEELAEIEKQLGKDGSLKLIDGPAPAGHADWKPLVTRNAYENFDPPIVDIKYYKDKDGKYWRVKEPPLPVFGGVAPLPKRIYNSVDDIIGKDSRDLGLNQGDILIIDIDGDGKPERVSVVALGVLIGDDGSRTINTIYIDTDGDGVADKKVRYDVNDGKRELTVSDYKSKKPFTIDK